MQVQDISFVIEHERKLFGFLGVNISLAGVQAVMQNLGPFLSFTLTLIQIAIGILTIRHLIKKNEKNILSFIARRLGLSYRLRDTNTQEGGTLSGQGEKVPRGDAGGEGDTKASRAARKRKGERDASRRRRRKGEPVRHFPRY
jgi:hypothetical protein